MPFIALSALPGVIFSILFAFPRGTPTHSLCRFAFISLTRDCALNVNAPPPKRRWLRLRLEAGLIGHAADCRHGPSPGYGRFGSAAWRATTKKPRWQSSSARTNHDPSPKGEGFTDPPSGTLKDQPLMRSHPNKAVDVAFNQASEKQHCFERSTTDLRIWPSLIPKLQLLGLSSRARRGPEVHRPHH